MSNTTDQTTGAAPENEGAETTTDQTTDATDQTFGDSENSASSGTEPAAASNTASTETTDDIETLTSETLSGVNRIPIHAAGVVPSNVTALPLGAAGVVAPTAPTAPNRFLPHEPFTNGERVTSATESPLPLISPNQRLVSRFFVGRSNETLQDAASQAHDALQEFLDRKMADNVFIDPVSMNSTNQIEGHNVCFILTLLYRENQ